MRWAVFLPMPGARASIAVSPVMMARVSSFKGMHPRICRAVLGPMPLMPVSLKNIRFSSWEEKPYRSTPSSRTLI